MDPSTEDTRKYAIEEILVTEEHYVQDLATIITKYMRPIQAQRLLTPADTKRLFGDIMQVFEFQEVFYRRLLTASRRPPDRQLIGKLFIDHVEGFKSYTYYCSNHPNALAVLLKLEKKPRFRALQDGIRQEENGKGNKVLDLDGLIIAPVQRICRYPLLLSALLRHTPCSHPDYPYIEDALEAMSGVTRYINEMKRKIESLQEVLALQHRMDDWQGPTLLGCGGLIHRGDLTVAVGDGPKRGRLVLFCQKRVVCCEPRGRRYMYTCGFPPDELRLSGRSDVFSKNGWRLISADDPARTLHLQAKNPQEKDEWIQKLSEVVPKFHEKGPGAIVRVPSTQQNSAMQATDLQRKKGKIKPELGFHHTQTITDLDLKAINPNLGALLSDAKSSIDLVKKANDQSKAASKIAAEDIFRPENVQKPTPPSVEIPPSSAITVNSNPKTDSAEQSQHPIPATNGANNDSAENSTSETPQGLGDSPNEVDSLAENVEGLTSLDELETEETVRAMENLAKVLSADHVCRGCGQPIEEAEAGVSAAGAAWHTRCLKCTQCDKELCGGSFYWQDGHAYCTTDYEAMYQCIKCENTLAGGVYIVLGGQKWHRDCMVCVDCGTVVAEAAYEKAGQLYCLGDYQHRFGEFCYLCKEVISGQYTQALDHSWHASCFVCNEPSCGASLSDGFYEIEGRPYCRYHHSKATGMLCTRCADVLDGQYVPVGSAKYHVHCLICKGCQQPIKVGDPIREDGESLYHPHC
eukprot:comp22823_c0_seq1/m.35869 comp22823_c0_seq1/g.35869  ORF comp22823_c0_seq1/g.35869 comp22823_c0_seq1/m.35869 type:complete len:747 (-) comp22823_c0_seq1:296-2536(-)